MKHSHQQVNVRRGSRGRGYLTSAEIERLMTAARNSSRYGHRDATMILCEEPRTRMAQVPALRLANADKQ